MRLIEEHRPQTILALLQAGVVLIGSLGLAVITKGTDSYARELPLFTAFARSWGFMMLVVPCAWVVTTIWLEFQYDWYSRRHTIVSGLLLVAGLVWLFIEAVARMCFMTMSNS